MKTSFLDALTHNGPGYQPSPEGALDGSRSTISRFLDALTHSGPGYDLAQDFDVAEISRLKREKMKALYDLLLEGLELNLYALGNLEAASRESDADEREMLIRSAVGRLRAYLHLTGQPMEIAVTSARESLGPLDMRAKFNLRKLGRLMSSSRASVKSTLDAENPASHRDIPMGPKAAVKQGSRSIEVICHAVAR
ncbi:hypothetical protein [Streptomyces sp. NPDC087270]|uniref:hypothetical protein n=1 Tax=Streptomyces sp. NPDC087270 TaxID=3365774 RepID=UPI00380C47C2